MHRGRKKDGKPSSSSGGAEDDAEATQSIMGQKLLNTRKIGGYLVKQGVGKLKTKKAKQYFFEVRGNELAWYERPPSSVRGVEQIDGAVGHMKFDDSLQIAKIKGGFSLTTSKKAMNLFTENDQQTDYWIQGLEKIQNLTKAVQSTSTEGDESSGSQKKRPTSAELRLKMEELEQLEKKVQKYQTRLAVESKEEMSLLFRSLNRRMMKFGAEEEAKLKELTVSVNRLEKMIVSGEKKVEGINEELQEGINLTLNWGALKAAAAHPVRQKGSFREASFGSNRDRSGSGTRIATVMERSNSKHEEIKRSTSRKEIERNVKPEDTKSTTVEKDKDSPREKEIIISEADSHSVDVSEISPDLVAALTPVTLRNALAAEPMTPGQRNRTGSGNRMAVRVVKRNEQSPQSHLKSKLTSTIGASELLTNSDSSSATNTRGKISIEIIFLTIGSQTIAETFPGGFLIANFH